MGAREGLHPMPAATWRECSHAQPLAPWSQVRNVVAEVQRKVPGEQGKYAEVSASLAYASCAVTGDGAGMREVQEEEDGLLPMTVTVTVEAHSWFD